jgi:AcrR family transcriptional regulator
MDEGIVGVACPGIPCPNGAGTMTAMPGLRQRHMDRNRAAIVDAALSLFAEQGFTETTVDAIAERAQVARRTFFRYFPAKEDVLFHDVDEQIALVIDALVARPEDEPPYEALVAVLRETAGQFAIDIGRRRLMARVAREGDNLIVHHRAVIMRRLEEAVTAEITRRASVEPDDLATGAAVAALLAAYGSAVRHWILSDAERPFGPMVDTALGAAQQALAGTPAGSSVGNVTGCRGSRWPARC